MKKITTFHEITEQIMKRFDEEFLPLASTARPTPEHCVWHKHSDLKRFFRFACTDYHNLLLDHLVKKLPKKKEEGYKFANSDSNNYITGFSDAGFNNALDQVREMLEGEKVK